MENKGIIANKTLTFGIRIVKLYQYLTEINKERIYNEQTNFAMWYKPRCNGS
jgi:hypothetical protein